MPKTAKSPSTVLVKLMEEYQQNPFSMSKAIHLSPSAVRLLVIGKSKITVPTALRLAKFFGKTAAFWLDVQREADLAEAGKDKKLQSVLKKIAKVKKPTAKTKKKATVKPARKKTLRDKRKAGAKKSLRARPAKRKVKR